MMARNFFRTLGIGANPAGGEIPEINVQMMPEGNLQMYPGSNEHVMPGTNMQMYPGQPEQTAPATNAQMYPGTSPQMYPGTNGQMVQGEIPHLTPGVNPQTMSAVDQQMYSASNDRITETHSQVMAGAYEQVMHETHAQMMAGTNAQLISETNAETIPDAYTQMMPGVIDQMSTRTDTQIVPGENIQSMPSCNTQVMVSDSSAVVYDQYPQNLACPNQQTTEGISMQSAHAEMTQPHHLQMQSAFAMNQGSNNNQPESVSTNKANQKAQYNQEITEDDEALRRVHSAYTPVGDRSKTSQILGVGCRLLWILYLLTAGLYLLTDGFREVTRDVFHTLGTTMILVGVAFLIGAFYLGYKTIGRHCIPVVAVPQANYGYRHFNESYRQTRQHGLQSPAPHTEQIALQQVPGHEGRVQPALPHNQQIVSSNNSNREPIGSGLASTGDQVVLSRNVGQQEVTYDSASHGISPSVKQLGSSPNADDRQLANSPKQHDQQLVLSASPSYEKGGYSLRPKTSLCSREVQSSTPSEHKALNLNPSEEQESPPSHESSKLLTNQDSP